MRLTDEGLKDRQVWLDHGYTLPQYDRGRMRQRRWPRRAGFILAPGISSARIRRG